MLKKGVFWPLHTRRLQNGTAPLPGSKLLVDYIYGILTDVE